MPCWDESRMPIAYERKQSVEGEVDVFTHALLACVGRGLPSTQNLLQVQVDPTGQGEGDHQGRRHQEIRLD